MGLYMLLVSYFIRRSLHVFLRFTSRKKQN